MDLFKLLSRGARLTSEDRAVLGRLQGKQKVDRTEIERRVDFFRRPEKRAREDDFEGYDGPAPPQLVVNQDEAEQLRKHFNIRVEGDDATLPIGSFQDLRRRFNIDHKLLHNLEKMGFDRPTGIQSEAIPILMKGNDILASAPTGSGKTLAFLVPVIQGLVKHGKADPAVRAVVISPTRELAAQLYETAVKLSRGTSLSAALVDRKLIRVWRENPRAKPAHLLVSTPQRLLAALREKLVDLSKVQFVIMDEADRLFENVFVKQTDEVLAACTDPHVVKAAFSATIPEAVEQLAASVMTSPVRVIVGNSEAAPEHIEQSLLYCGNEQGKLMAVRQLLTDGGVAPPILLFVQSIERAKALCDELLYDKLNVDAIHSDMSQAQRNKIVESFKSGEIWLLICTDVLARGVDFHGVNVVINYDIPLTAEAYLHRIGRTGRAGRRGKAVTYYTKQDMTHLKDIVHVMKESGCEIGDWLLHSARNKAKPKRRERISTQLEV